MNIFALSLDPHEAARWAIDKHVVKMVLETAQILSTVSWRYGVEAPYRATHAQHPCTLWAGETAGNWHWLIEHGRALADEYARRYGKEHKSRAVIEWAALHGGRPADGDLTLFAQAMPDEYRQPDPVLAYRAYYLGDKARMASWREPAAPPPWWASNASLTSGARK